MAPRQKRIFLMGAAVFPLVHFGWFTYAQRPEWFHVAEWFRRLPLT
jgi:hypothetical protein